MKIICTLNLKGGCAKTTTAVSMAELLATGFKSKHGTVKPGKVLILSILVDTFISKISFPMQPGPEIGSISDA